MKTKQRFSVEQHWLMGQLLYHTYMALQSQLVIIGNVYPLKSPQVRRLERSLKELGEARSAMDSALFQEHPDAASTQAYYPCCPEGAQKSVT